MGHLINPTCFRLGKSVDWKSKWVVQGKNAYRETLQDDLLIYKYLTIFFKKYTIPGFSNRWQRKTMIERKAGKRLSGKHNVLLNPFGEVCKLLISHVKIIRGKRLIIRSEFFDAKFEIYANNIRARTRAKYSWEYVYKYIVSKDESIDRNWYRPFTYSQIPNIRELALKDLRRLQMGYRTHWLKAKWKRKPIRTITKLMDRSYKRKCFDEIEYIMYWISDMEFKDKIVFLTPEARKKIAYRLRRLRKWARKKYSLKERMEHARKSEKKKRRERFKNKVVVIKKDFLYEKKKKIIIKKIVKEYKKTLRLLKKMEKLMLIRSYFVFREETYEQIFENIRFESGKRKKRLVITKVLLKTMRIWVKLTANKKIYYVILLRNMLITILNEAKKVPNVLKGKITMSYLRLLNLLTYVDFSYQYMGIYKYTLHHINNYFIFSKSSNIIRYSLNCIEKKREVDLEYFAFGLNKTTASLIVNYIVIHLKKFFRLGEILRPLIRELKRKSIVKSYRIQVAGRLTRKQRAWYSVRETEGVGYSKKMLTIDYAQDKTSLKFGAVGVKVWLVYNYKNHYKLNYIDGAQADIFSKQYYYKLVFRYGKEEQVMNRIVKKVEKVVI